MNDKFIVYLIKSQKDESIYVGCTTNLVKRLEEHNNGLSNYTSSKMPWYLIWHAVFHDKMKAFEFEKYLKSSSGKAFANKRLI